MGIVMPWENQGGGLWGGNSSVELVWGVYLLEDLRDVTGTDAVTMETG